MSVTVDDGWLVDGFTGMLIGESDSSSLDDGFSPSGRMNDRIEIEAQWSFVLCYYFRCNMSTDRNTHMPH